MLESAGRLCYLAFLDELSVFCATFDELESTLFLDGFRRLASVVAAST